jgi:hypothetical protein
MSYNTREIAGKLIRYSMLLRSEIEKATLGSEFSESAAELIGALESELDSVQDMSNYLWDIKESV